MAAIVWSDVLEVAPELTSVSAGLQTLLLAFANRVVNVDIFGGETAPELKLARSYLVAHFASQQGAGSTGAQGPITSESAGGLARSYGQMLAAGASAFSGTSYGALFYTLIRMFAGGAHLID